MLIKTTYIKNNKYEKKYIGSAFCFSNDGTFKGFNAFPSNDMFMLAGSIRETAEDFLKQYNTVERLVIHFYKTMSNNELKPIKKALFELGLDIHRKHKSMYMVGELLCLEGLLNIAKNNEAKGHRLLYKAFVLADLKGQEKLKSFISGKLGGIDVCFGLEDFM